MLHRLFTIACACAAGAFFERGDIVTGVVALAAGVFVPWAVRHTDGGFCGQCGNHKPDSELREVGGDVFVVEYKCTDCLGEE
jgi:hypothetical protein